MAALRRVAWLAELSDEALLRLAAVLDERDYPAGAIVVAEGDPGDELFVVVEGRAEVSASKPNGSVTLGTLHPGETFGEIALLEPTNRRTATVVALTPFRLLALAAAVVEELARQHPSIRTALVADAETLRIRQFLKEASPFAAVEGDVLRSIASHLQPVSVASGEVFIRQGEPGDRCYLIRSGQVEVLVERGGVQHFVVTLDPGSIVGETALLTDAPRTATVRATVQTELLALARSDLLAAIGEDSEVGARLLEVLRLRDRPSQVDGVLAEHRTTADGDTITILKNPARGAYFRLSREGWFIWQHLNGQNSLRDLTIAYLVEFKSFAPAAIADIVWDLARAGFVRARSVRPEVIAAIARVRWWQRPLVYVQRLVDLRVSHQADGFVDAMYRHGGFLIYRWPTLVLLALLVLSGLVAFFASGRNASAPAEPSGWIIIAAYLSAIVCHEMGHALTTKWAGRAVGRVGFGWYWFAPFAFVDTTDVWLATRWQRIAVTLAGPCGNLVVGSSLSLVAWLIDDPVLSPMLWGAAVLPYMGALWNLNPLLEYDGYFVLSDVLERPNMRRHALAWLGRELPRLVRGHPLTRGHAFELAYGAASVTYIVLMAAVTILVYRVFAQGWLASLLPAAVAAGLAFVLAGLVVAIAVSATVADIRGLRQPV